MPELIRPAPRQVLADRLRDHAGRLLAAARPVRLAIGVLVVAGAGVAVWWLLRSPAASVEERLPMAATARTTAAEPAVPSTSPSTGVSPVIGPDPAGVVVVQAAGAVIRPGVYRVAAGARVADLVAAAGGPAPEADLDAVALAAKLADGQRVYVPRRGEAVAAGEVAGAGVLGGAGGAGTGTAAGGSPSPGAPLDLNLATAQQLDLLPGVGPATAAAIVAYRAKHGPFRAVEELLEVRGIGAAKLDGVRDLVRV